VSRGIQKPPRKKYIGRWANWAYFFDTLVNGFDFCGDYTYVVKCICRQTGKASNS
jgi:hypothetical protein